MLRSAAPGGEVRQWLEVTRAGHRVPGPERPPSKPFWPLPEPPPRVSHSAACRAQAFHPHVELRTVLCCWPARRSVHVVRAATFLSGSPNPAGEVHPGPRQEDQGPQAPTGRPHPPCAYEKEPSDEAVHDLCSLVVRPVPPEHPPSMPDNGDVSAAAPATDAFPSDIDNPIHPSRVPGSRAAQVSATNPQDDSPSRCRTTLRRRVGDASTS